MRTSGNRDIGSSHLQLCGNRGGGATATTAALPPGWEVRRQAARRDRLFRDYGLTWSAYVEYLAWHDSRCAICRYTQAERAGRGSGPAADYCVDHDHAVIGEMWIRGLLCCECNTGLGTFKDRAALLTSAIVYLREAARRDGLRYPLTRREKQELSRQQGGRCAICASITRLVTDHDHATMLVRGLLCDPCNRGLGCFLDTPALLRAAHRYLTRPGTWTEVTTTNLLFATPVWVRY